MDDNNKKQFDFDTPENVTKTYKEVEIPIETKAEKTKRITVKCLIWILSIVLINILIVFCNVLGITLGGIPTVIIYVLGFICIKKLAKSWDEHCYYNSSLDKETKENLESTTKNRIKSEIGYYIGFAASGAGIATLFTLIISLLGIAMGNGVVFIIYLAFIIVGIGIASFVTEGKRNYQPGTNKDTTKPITQNLIYKKISSQVLDLCEVLIDKYQTHTTKPSCKSDLIKFINNRLESAKNEVIGWETINPNYEIIAHNLLAHATFDLLASGEYHLYYGMLNPMSCADNIMDVYKATMDYGLKTNQIDEATKKEQYEYLLKCISQVG